MQTEYFMGCGGHFEDTELDKLEKSGLYIAEPKYDGIWSACVSTLQGQKFYSRNGKEKDVTMPTIPAGTILAGELGFGSQQAQKRIAQLGHEYMDVFDILQWQGKDVSGLDDVDRRALLEKVYSGFNANIKKYFFLAPRWTKDFAKQYKAQDEGLVLKQIKGRPSHPYVIGTRTPYWFKVKKELSVDMIIMDYEVSTSKTFKGTGAVKYLVCGVYDGNKLVELVHVGSMTHELRKDIAKNWNNYKGKVIEINCFKVFKSGSLRHPSLKCIRNDKAAKDCTLKSILDLVD